MNFRRCITVLAVFALFAGLASAQVADNSATGGGPFQCNAAVVPPNLRAEGMTELVGDIVLTCTGGGSPALNSATPLPTAQVTVSLGANVTSRLLTYATVNPSAITATNTSEALLLIDEPGAATVQVLQAGVYGNAATNAPGFGPNATQYLCGAAAANTPGTPSSLVGAGPGGCVEYASEAADGDFVMSTTSAIPGLPAPNMFAGVVQANQVVFYGIPIMPPSSTGSARIFRITNLRVNANTLAGGGLAGTTAVVASIAINGTTSVLVNNNVPTVGYIQSGLSSASTGIRNTSNTGGGSAPNFNQCNNASVGTSPNLAILRFADTFGTAFKTRVAPMASSTAFAGNVLQNVPGFIYNSESGFVTNLISGATNSAWAGLSDYGTRLKAVFNNVPANVTIYVTTSNVVNLFQAAATAPAYPSTAPYAQLVLTETASDGAGGSAGTPPVVTPTNYVQTAGLVNLIGYAPATMVAPGQYEAVWEVMNTNTATLENFDFGVYVAYNATASSPVPTTTPATVTLSYAPTATEGAFAIAAGVAASSTLTVPRFSDAASAAIPLFNIVPCTTTLLFPFITNQAGYDTGIALMNTSQDPFGTTPQTGTCQMNFFGQNAPTPVVTPAIPAGNNVAPAGNYAFLASMIAPNFEGYMIAVCNFQLAHGLAFLQEGGSSGVAVGYVGLVVPTGTGKRTTTPEQLDQ